MEMFKKYDYRLVHGHRSYTIKEIVRLFKEQNLHDKTVRSWIRSGDLEVIDDGNKLLVYGAILKQFLKNRGKSRQRTLGVNEFLCCKCRNINAPLENTIISAVIQNNGSIRACGLCPNCAFEMKRLYKRAESKLILDLFKLEPEALIVLSDSSCSTYNAHPQIDQKLSDPESQGHSLSHVTQDSIISKDLIQPKPEVCDAQN